MSCCNGNCGCGTNCSCGSGCKGCGRSETLVLQSRDAVLMAENASADIVSYSSGRVTVVGFASSENTCARCGCSPC